jgi:hypothetical protein
MCPYLAGAVSGDAHIHYSPLVRASEPPITEPESSICPNYDLTRTLELATEDNGTYLKFKIRLAMIFVVTVLAQPQGASWGLLFPFGLPIPVFYGPAYYPSCCYGPYGYAH